MMNKIKPLKKFGQNYLQDKNILKKIADEINPSEDDLLLEIGPGTGALTEFLIGKTKNLYAVEIDTRVIEELKKHFPSVNIINKDILKFNLKEFSDQHKKKIRIAGNIPYNLTSPIIFELINCNNKINDAVFMIQYEVAKRITAEKGTKDYGILSVLLKYFADVEFCFKVSSNVFYPRPKVSSAVIHIYFKEMNIDKTGKDYFIKIVKAAFGNRRKTLKNSLNNSIFKDTDFSGSGIDLSLRAEQLNVNDFEKLALFARKSLT